MKRHQWITIVLLLAVVTAPGWSVPLVADDFLRMDPNWTFLSTSHGTSRVMNGVMRVTAVDGATHWSLYGSRRFSGVDLSADVRIVNQRTVGGLVFGYTSSTLYAFQCSAYGTYSLSRGKDNFKTWLPCVPRTRNSAVREGTAVWNRLRVVIRGNEAALYANGQHLASVQVALPEGGGAIGLLCSAGSKGEQGTVDFAHFRAEP